MQHRQPGTVLRVEALGRDLGQLVGLGGGAVFAVHLQEQRHRWLRLRHTEEQARSPFAPPAIQHVHQGRANGGRTTWTDAVDSFQPAGLSRALQRFERVNPKRLMQAPGQIGADARDGAKQRLRVRIAAQAFQLLPVPRLQQLDDRGRDPLANARQRVQRSGASAVMDLPQG